jgi:hypothetical protein
MEDKDRKINQLEERIVRLEQAVLNLSDSIDHINDRHYDYLNDIDPAYSHR